MGTLNAINSAVINVGGTGANVLKESGLLDKDSVRHSRITIVSPGAGTTFSCDATISETHNYESQPTVFPVEDGSTISDHIIQSPVTVTFTGVVTDTPFISRANLDLLVETELSALISGFIPPLGVTVATGAVALYNVIRNAPAPSQVAFGALTRLRGGQAAGQLAPQPFSLYTKYRRYDDMVITSLSFPVDSSTDGMLTFTCTCTRIVLVTPELINVSQVKNAASSANIRKLGNADGYYVDDVFNKGKKTGERVYDTGKGYATKAADSISSFLGIK